MDDLSDQNDSDFDVENNSTFKFLMDMAKKKNENNWQKKREKYIKEGYSEKEATQKADKKILNDDREVFTDGLSDFLILVHGIEENPLKDKILQNYELYKKLSPKRAMKKAVRKYMTEFEDLLEGDMVGGQNEQDDDDDDDTDDDDAEEEETDDNNDDDVEEDDDDDDDADDDADDTDDDGGEDEEGEEEVGEGGNAKGTKLVPYKPDVQKWMDMFDPKKRK